MKMSPATCAWSVRSVTDRYGRRLITLCRLPNLRAGKPTACPPPWHSFLHSVRPLRLPARGLRPANRLRTSCAKTAIPAACDPGR